MDLEAARSVWTRERPEYQAFGMHLAGRLRQAAAGRGIVCEVTSRAKDVHSLVKKLIKKPEHTYASLPDKAGVRCVARYLSDLEALVDMAQQLFSCGTVDRKAEGLGADRLGYVSIHVDVSPRADDPEVIRFGTYRAELQIRTLGQHLWSEMSHDAVYKNDDLIATLPDPFRRRVNLMAGLIEVADQEFDRLNRELPTDPAVELYRLLERHYFELATERPDPELSLYLIRLLLPLYGGSPITEIEAQLEQFVDLHKTDLAAVFARPSTTETSALLSQPEVLMLYERLEEDQLAIRTCWANVLPEFELEKVANAFGISFD